MASGRTLGIGLIGAAMTMLVRSITRRAMHDRRGTLKLPRAASRANGLTTVLALAAASGALLALGDVLQEQRKHLAQST